MGWPSRKLRELLREMFGQCLEPSVGLAQAVAGSEGPVVSSTAGVPPALKELVVEDQCQTLPYTAK